MNQIALPAVFMRGGTSKGLFFHRRDLPAARAEWDALFLAALGSPDPHGRQLDGMGGGISSLSKVVVVSPSTRPGVDIDYLFGQVAVDRALVDYRSNCGNLTAAVGPFAVDEGLVQAADGEAALTLHNCNLGQTIETRFAVRNGRAVVEGETVLDGVDRPGRAHRPLLPGAGRRRHRPPAAHGARPRRARRAGRGRHRGHADRRIDRLGHRPCRECGPDRGRAAGRNRGPPCPHRAAGGDPPRRAAAMGLAPETASVPKVAFVAPPADAPTLSGAPLAADAVDLTARAISMGRPHRALPLTAALALAAAARIPGTLAAEAARPVMTDASPVRLGHPSGVAEVAVDLAATDPARHIARLTVTRTARRLMEGRVLVPAGRLSTFPTTGHHRRTPS